MFFAAIAGAQDGKKVSVPDASSRQQPAAGIEMLAQMPVQFLPGNPLAGLGDRLVPQRPVRAPVDGLKPGAHVLQGPHDGPAILFRRTAGDDFTIGRPELGHQILYVLAGIVHQQCPQPLGSRGWIGIVFEFAEQQQIGCHFPCRFQFLLAVGRQLAFEAGQNLGKGAVAAQQAALTRI
ncbi:MAG: hypothetical protein K2Q10_01540, partial [Rhodospirillales bacterium]|nr:hypothetical protein [Rhodospirillales bacterium]